MSSDDLGNGLFMFYPASRPRNLQLPMISCSGEPTHGCYGSNKMTALAVKKVRTVEVRGTTADVSVQRSETGTGPYFLWCGANSRNRSIFLDLRVLLAFPVVDLTYQITIIALVSKAHSMSASSILCF
jgi:hypothetical protein